MEHTTILFLFHNPTFGNQLIKHGIIGIFAPLNLLQGSDIFVSQGRWSADNAVALVNQDYIHQEPCNMTIPALKRENVHPSTMNIGGRCITSFLVFRSLISAAIRCGTSSAVGGIYSVPVI